MTMDILGDWNLRQQQHLVRVQAIGTHDNHNSYYDNESTTGADASVEMPKLHNIKLLMHMMNNLILLHAKTQRLGNDRP